MKEFVAGILIGTCFATIIWGAIFRSAKNTKGSDGYKCSFVIDTGYSDMNAMSRHGYWKIDKDK